MPLTKASFAVINVAGTITSTTVGNTTSIPSFTFDQNGVITSASNTAISGAGITANTVANSAFQTGSVENYLRGANLDFGMRNRIINGAMVIDQRNAGASVTPADGDLTLDRWKAYQSVSSKYSLQQNAGSVTPPTGFTSYLGCTSLSSYSVASNNYFGIVQRIEGFNTADLGWGTANAKTLTLSFWVRSSLTGTFGGSFTNANFSRSYPFTYTISSANTWEYNTVTVAGDTTGTWLTNNGTGIEVGFGLGVGSSYSGTAGAWAAGWFLTATGATSVVGTNGATFYITGVQLEVGSTATSFNYRPYGTELALCQRYYINYGNRGSGYSASAPYLRYPLFNENTISAGLTFAIAQYPVQMRIDNPTFTAYTAFNGSASNLSNTNWGPFTDNSNQRSTPIQKLTNTMTTNQNIIYLDFDINAEL